MQAMFTLFGFAAVIIAIGFALHGFPSIITINKYYDNCEEEDDE